MMDVQEAVNKPSVYMEGDRAVYRASSLLSCVNALLAARLGTDGTLPPEWMQKRFDAGHDHEPLILARLERDYGFVLYGHQATMEIDVGFKAMIRGHVDALAAAPFRVTFADNGNFVEADVEVDEGVVVIDAKALSQSSYERWVTKRWGAFPYYLWQQYIYVVAGDFAGVVMAVKNKNTDDMVVEYFTKAALERLVTKADLIRKVLQVERLAANGPEQLFAQPCDRKMFPCPYWFLHPEEETKTVGGVLDELKALVEDRAQVDAKVKLLQLEREVIDRAMRELLKEPVTAYVPGFTVSTYYATSTSTDWDALAEDLKIDVDKAKGVYQVKKTSDKLSVKVTEKRAAA